MKKIHSDNKNGAWLPEENMYKVANIFMKYDCSEEDGNINKVNNAVDERSNIETLSETSIYNELKEYRYKKSKEEKVNPYIIFYNSTL